MWVKEYHKVIPILVDVLFYFVRISALAHNQLKP